MKDAFVNGMKNKLALLLKIFIIVLICPMDTERKPPGRSRICIQMK